MLSSGSVAVGADARAIAEVVLHPPLPRALQPAFWALSKVTITLLPPELRQQYGFRCGSATRAVVGTSRHFARRAIPLLPERVRLLWPPSAHAGPDGLALDAIVALQAALGVRASATAFR
jgi:uncharacterized protein (DUF2236 family)